ncbi:MAG: helix-turn-helix transcriptional regulator [Candidatus Omnitrophica bacterium]|nr:helix-turn-helix transcriptional regulator [Candidatus Omnitrophota bacterium]
MAEKFYRKLGQRIRVYRKLAKLTLEALAERAELDGRYVGFIERGEAHPSLDSLQRLASALGVSVEEFFQFTKDQPGEVSELIRRMTQLLKHRNPEEVRHLCQVLLQIVALLPPTKRTRPRAPRSS